MQEGLWGSVSEEIRKKTCVRISSLFAISHIITTIINHINILSNLKIKRTQSFIVFFSGHTNFYKAIMIDPYAVLCSAFFDLIFHMCIAMSKGFSSVTLLFMKRGQLAVLLGMYQGVYGPHHHFFFRLNFFLMAPQVKLLKAFSFSFPVLF